MKIPKVIVFNDFILSPCAFWRSQGVLSELARQGEIELMEGVYTAESWAKLRQNDIAFFQRPMSKRVKDQVFMAKDLGLKIIIDLDDTNQINPSHEVYDLWCDEYDEKTFYKVMMMADIVTVSTKQLKDYYLKYHNNVVVVPNAINNHWLPFMEKSNNNIVIWRGGKHHLPDLYEYKNEIIDVMQSHKEWKLYCIGCKVKFFEGYIDNYEYKEEFDVHDYLAFIIRTNPSIFIVPLSKNEINLGKSNISWQEATLSGAVALVPNYWNLYRCGMVYEDKESFKYQFNKLISDNKLRTILYNNSFEKVNKEYLLSNINKQRLEIIKNLMK